MFRRLAPLFAALLLVACDEGLSLGGPARPSASPSAAPSPAASGSPGASASPATPASTAPTADPRLPAEAPTIEGQILTSDPAGAGQLHAGRIQVSTTDGSNQAVVTIATSTAVWRQGMGGALARASAAELRVGQRVRVWAGGPVRESFPIQFDAKAILILAES